MTERMLPPEQWDKCRHCGSVRKERHGTSGAPACFRQGCPGQHSRLGLPLSDKEREEASK